MAATVLASEVFPEIDAGRQLVISDEQAQFFRENGLLLIHNVFSPAELKAMQDATLPLYQRAVNEKPAEPDYCYAKHELTGEMTPYRIEYVIDKKETCKRLLGHPFILRSIEKLQGRNFIPTWDAMVFKKEGMGKAIPWHRDSAAYQRDDVDNTVAAINVDFYLDASDMTNCLWGILGSNNWPAERAQETIQRLNDAPGRFSTDEMCLPLPVGAGDVLFHSVLTLHGSPAAQSKLRRVVYYEFRPGEVELAHGPHTPEYLPLKQKVLQAALRERRSASYASGERAFEYRPDGRFAVTPLGEDEAPATFRYPHQEYWRKG